MPDAFEDTRRLLGLAGDDDDDEDSPTRRSAAFESTRALLGLPGDEERELAVSLDEASTAQETTREDAPDRDPKSDPSVLQRLSNFLIGDGGTVDPQRSRNIAAATQEFAPGLPEGETLPGGAEAITKSLQATTSGPPATVEDILQGFGADVEVPGSEVPEGFELAGGLSRGASEIGSVFAGGAGIGSLLSRGGALARAAGATRAGRGLFKAGRSGGALGDVARFGPVDALFAQNPETSGAVALDELAGTDAIPRGGDILSRAARATAETGLGAIPAAAIDAGRGVRSVLREADEGAEGIAEAAIRLPNGDVVEAPTHMEAAGRALEAGAVDDPGDLAQATDGFVTTEGRFVDRESGTRLAQDAGQIPPSEDPDDLLTAEFFNRTRQTDEAVEELDDPASSIMESTSPRRAGPQTSEEILGGDRVAQAGAVDPELLRAGARVGTPAAAGAGVGAAVDEENRGRGALLGGAAGASLSVLGPKWAEAMLEGRRQEVDEISSTIAARERKNLQRLVEEGEVTPAQADPVATAVERSQPKDIDVNEVIRRVTDRVGTRTQQEAKRLFESVQDVVERGDIDARRIPRSEQKRVAEALDFDPEVLDQFVEGDVRLQGLRSLTEISAASKAIADFDNMAARLHGQVSADEWDKLMGVRNQLEDQMESIASKRLKAGSEAGRLLEAQKAHVLANATFDPDNASPWIVRARRLSNEKLDADDISEIQRILNDGNRDEMVEFMHQMQTKGQNWGERTASWVKAGLLTAPKTDLVNVGSTMSHIALRQMENPTAAFADLLMSRASGQRGKSVTMSLKDNTMGVIDGLRTGINGNEELGIRGARQVFRSGGADQLAKYDFRGVRTGNPLVDGYFAYAFNRLGAEDRVMKGLAFHSSLMERARVSALNEGLSRGSDAWKRRVKELTNPATAPDGLVKAAIQDAEVATFTNISPTGSSINAFKNVLRESGGTGALVAELGIPFVNTLVNVGDAMVKRVPGIGLARGVLGKQNAKDFANLVRQGLPGETSEAVARSAQRGQRKLAESLSQQGTGLALMTLGFRLREEGKMTGSFPDDERANVFRQSNLQPYAIRMDQLPVMGGIAAGAAGLDPEQATVSIENVSPGGNLVALGGAYYDLINSDEYQGRVDEKVTGTAAAMFEQLSELTFLANVSSGLQAVTNPERSDKFLENLGRMAVPTVLRQVATSDVPGVGDPVLRKQDGPLDAIRASTPGLSRTLEPQIEPSTGEPRTRKPANLIEALSNPFRVEGTETDPTVQTLTKIGVGVPDLSTLPRRDVEGEKRTKLERVYGRMVHKAATQELVRLGIVRPDQIDDLSPETREALGEHIGGVIESTRRSITTALEDRGVLPPSKDEDVQEPFFLESGGAGGGSLLNNQ